MLLPIPLEIGTLLAGSETHRSTATGADRRGISAYIRHRRRKVFAIRDSLIPWTQIPAAFFCVRIQPAEGTCA
ncbi:hypothetical protein CUJ84_pRLN5000125 (plasmid) [Rhizobium leguminosarum]|uniref:Uncharacterized protein n=1 Tax=Rhizobium leguminosarum TaxID=384 RepID=A0A2K9ZIQ9_RHILE|nr:hypothetical protein CUJ84_pRLN5000125 [Rhizobium leguminosarum]